VSPGCEVSRRCRGCFECPGVVIEKLWFHRKTKAHNDVSWYQSRPATSLQLIEACGVGKQEDIIDVINSIDPGTAFRVSFPLSGAQQERRYLFRSPSVQAQLGCTPFRTMQNWM
jgi:hypothetical protein